MKNTIVALLLLILAGGVVMAEKQIINLPEPKLSGKMSVEEAIARRRSERSFSAEELTMDQISQLLWSAQGITDKSWGFRAAPSAGSLYPLTVYILKKDGLFQYLPDGHKLVQISTEDKRPSLVRASLTQSFIGEAPLVIIIAGNFRIIESKYGQRAYRYLNMEIGHAAENIHLQAAALGLVSVPVGAFWDDVVAKTMELPDTQDPFYIIPVGYLKTSS
jgi:SagB-type dehydrogenase family enzyme